MEITTTTYTSYNVVQLYKGTKTVSSYSTQQHDTYEAAVKEWENEYRDRNKGDEYDEYWNAQPCVILCETKIRTLIL